MSYLLYAGAFLAALAVEVIRRRDPTLLAAYFVAGGLTIATDYIALGLMELYYYRPGFFQSAIPDTAAGVMLAELGIAAPLSAVLSGVPNRWAAVVAGTVSVTLLEVLFAEWGILWHRGWQVWWTAAAFPLYFGVVHAYRQACLRYGLREGWRRVLLRIGLLVFIQNIQGLVANWMLGLVTYRIDVLPTFARNQALGNFLADYLFSTPLFYWVLATPGKKAWRNGSIALAAMLAVDYAMVAFGFAEFYRPWHWSFKWLTRSALLGLIFTVDRWLGAWAKR